MKMKRLPIIACVVFAMLLVATGTIALLKSIDPKNDTPQNTSTNDTSGETKNAQSIEDEANALLHTDPAKAQEMFIEAEKLHEESGDDIAASESRRNAASAEAAKNALKAAKDQLGEGATAEAGGPNQ